MSLEDRYFKKSILNTLSSKLNLKLLILFGSFAKKTQTNNSDLDLAFLSKDNITNIERWNISQSLASDLNIDVDLIDLQKASDVLKFQIVSTGEIIYNTENFGKLS